MGSRLRPGGGSSRGPSRGSARRSQGPATNKAKDNYHFHPDPLRVLVRVVEARNLACDGEIMPLGSPRATVSIGSYQESTRAIRNTADPVWQESFILPLDRYSKPDIIVKVIDDSSLMINNRLGSCLVRLSKVVPDEVSDVWIDMEDAPTGSIHLQLVLKDLQTDRVRTRPSYQFSSSVWQRGNDDEGPELLQRPQYEEAEVVTGDVFALCFPGEEGVDEANQAAPQFYDAFFQARKNQLRQTLGLSAEPVVRYSPPRKPHLSSATPSMADTELIPDQTEKSKKAETLWKRAKRKSIAFFKGQVGDGKGFDGDGLTSQKLAQMHGRLKQGADQLEGRADNLEQKIEAQGRQLQQSLALSDLKEPQRSLTPAAVSSFQAQFEQANSQFEQGKQRLEKKGSEMFDAADKLASSSRGFGHSRDPTSILRRPSTQPPFEQANSQFEQANSQFEHANSQFEQGIQRLEEKGSEIFDAADKFASASRGFGDSRDPTSMWKRAKRKSIAFFKGQVGDGKGFDGDGLTSQKLAQMHGRLKQGADQLEGRADNLEQKIEAQGRQLQQSLALSDLKEPQRSLTPAAVSSFQAQFEQANSQFEQANSQFEQANSQFEQGKQRLEKKGSEMFDAADKLASSSRGFGHSRDPTSILRRPSTQPPPSQQSDQGKPKQQRLTAVAADGRVRVSLDSLSQDTLVKAKILLAQTVMKKYKRNSSNSTASARIVIDKQAVEVEANEFLSFLDRIGSTALSPAARNAILSPHRDVKFSCVLTSNDDENEVHESFSLAKTEAGSPKMVSMYTADLEDLLIHFTHHVAQCLTDRMRALVVIFPRQFHGDLVRADVLPQES